MTGKVDAICTSLEKGTRKIEVGSAILKTGWGIEGDAHAGSRIRQVSLLAAEEIRKVKARIPDLRPGDFAENIITSGVNPPHVKVGDRFFIGESVELEVSQIGKECHSACRIQELTGECIMPIKGIFTRVLQGGLVTKDSPVRFVSSPE